MIKHSIVEYKFICFFAVAFMVSFISCNNKGESLTQKQSTDVRYGVQQMMALVAKDISKKGPVAWLTYFENTPGFFMASDGQLVFPNDDSATNFIKNTLIKQIQKITLKWNDVRVDPLTFQLAGVAANWHENITGFSGNTLSINGYFTAIAEKTPKGWQLRNAHWSVLKTP